MTMPAARLGVFTRSQPYRAAVAELPLSAVLSDEVRGAVAVVPGVGDWWQGLLSARDQGAAAVVLAEPEMLPQESFRPGSRPKSWPGDILVVVERPRLRPDLVSDAVQARQGSPARIFTVETASTFPALDDVIRDGLGWVRSLAQAPLALAAGRATSRGRVGLLEIPVREGGSISATIVGTVLGGPGSSGLLQVLALGEVRTELLLDQPAGSVRLETATAAGILRAPQRYESSPRLALRRAMAALSSGEPMADLDELMQDMALARQLRNMRPEGEEC